MKRRNDTKIVSDSSNSKVNQTNLSDNSRTVTMEIAFLIYKTLALMNIMTMISLKNRCNEEE